MSYTIDYDDNWYDNGYGGVNGVLQIEIEPVFTDESFDAHNEHGVLQLYGNNKAVTSIKLLDAVFFAVGNNGEEIGEYQFDSIEDLAQFGIYEDNIIEDVTELIARES